MNKKNISSIFIFIFSIFILVSCDNEPLDPALANQINTGGGATGGGATGGGTSGGGSTGGGGTSSGDYWPAALNNQWVLSQNGVQQQPMKMVSINSINGNTYYTFNQSLGQGSSGTSGSAVTRLRKSSGDYYLKVESLNINYGAGLTGVMTGFEMLLFKDYPNVGQSWNGSYSQTTTFNDPIYPVVTLNINYVGTILERGSSLTINGTTYANVLKFRVVQTTTFAGAPATDATTDYWYAKDIGPIKTITYDATMSPQYTSLLDSYILN